MPRGRQGLARPAAASWNPPAWGRVFVFDLGTRTDMPNCLAALLLLAVALCAPAAAQTAAPALSLTAAVETAMRDNPEVLLARERLAEFGYRVRATRADALPEVSVTGTLQRTRDPGLRNSPFFSRLASGDEPLPPGVLSPFYFGTYFYQVEVQQPLFRFGRVGHALEAARQELQGVEADVRGVETRVAFEVARAYYDFLLAEGRHAVLEAEREARERQLQQIRDRLDLGVSTRLELLQAEVALANLRPEELTAENAIRVSLTRLNGALGRGPLEPFAATETLTVPAGVPMLPPATRLVELAAEHRPELQRYRLSRLVLDEAEQVTRTDKLPEISARGSMGVNSFRLNNLSQPELHNWTMGLDVRWTLFDGHRTSATMAQIRSQRRQSELDEEAFRARLAGDLEAAAGSWRTAIQTVEVAGLALEQAREARRVAEELFALGAATFLEVLDAERALRQAELMRLQAVHAALTALAEVKALVGFRPDAPDSRLAAAPGAAVPPATPESPRP